MRPWSTIQSYCEKTRALCITLQTASSVEGFWCQTRAVHYSWKPSICKLEWVCSDSANLDPRRRLTSTKKRSGIRIRISGLTTVLKWPSKVTQVHRKCTHGSIERIRFHSKNDPILYHFPHIARYWSKIAKFICSTCIERPGRLWSRQNFAPMFSTGKLSWMKYVKSFRYKTGA